MRRFKRNAKNEEGRELIPAKKDGDGAMPEPSFEGVVSNRTFSRREAVGLTGAALAGFAALAATNANPAMADMAGSEATTPEGRAADKPDKAIKELSPVSSREAGANRFIPGVGNITATAYLPGPSSTNNRKYRLTGLHLTTSLPAVVQVQPRQGDNRDFGFGDQFAVQVITTAPDSIVVVVRRLDTDGGWGQNLRLDLFVVDPFLNP
jgi:hypothetical protein